MNTIQILLYKLRDIVQLVRQLFGYVATFLWALLRSKAALSARQTVWRSLKLKRAVSLYIDARMGAEILRLYALRPTDLDACEFYEGNLYDSDEAEQLPCSARSIIYCPAIAGALIAAQVKAFAVGELLHREVLMDIPGMKLIAT